MSSTITTTLLDLTIIEMFVDARLDIRHARWLRGAIGNRGARPEFHQHQDSGLIYRHPLIRYDTSSGNPRVAGLKEGAFLLKAFAPPDRLRLGAAEFKVEKYASHSARVELGVVEEQVEYDFVSPYLALNQQNNRRYRQSTDIHRKRMLESILCGNILSLCKSVGHHVQERIVVESKLHPTKLYTLKPGVRMLGFAGSFIVNFQLPDTWGLGKSSSRGFGTIIRRQSDG